MIYNFDIVAGKYSQNLEPLLEIKKLLAQKAIKNCTDEYACCCYILAQYYIHQNKLQSAIDEAESAARFYDDVLEKTADTQPIRKYYLFK